MPDHCAKHERMDVTCDDCRAARRESTLRYHDCHRAFCPACSSPIFWTDSPSMVQEARADGVPADETPVLITPIEAQFQGERAKIFPVKCPNGHSHLSFVDVVNRERIEIFHRDLKPYNPTAKAPDPMRRDVLVTLEEFAYRVSLERNKFVREALERKFNERGIGVQWIRPKYVAALDTG